MGYDATKTIYLIKLLDVLQELGLPLQEVKAAAAVADRELDDREGSIALSNYVDAVQQAVQQFVVPDLGFLVGEHTTPLEHGVLGYALISSSNLRQCLERYVRFQYLQGPLLDITFDASGDMASLTASPLRGRLRPSPGVYRYLVQEWLVGWNQWCRIIGRSGSFFEHVRLGYSAEGKEKHYEEHLGCTVSFDNEATTALFAARHLDRPLEYADESIASLCAVQCERLLEVLNLRSGLVAELHRQLVASPATYPRWMLWPRDWDLAPGPCGADSSSKGQLTNR